MPLNIITKIKLRLNITTEIVEGNTSDGRACIKRVLK